MKHEMRAVLLGSRKHSIDESQRGWAALHHVLERNVPALQAKGALVRREWLLGAVPEASEGYHPCTGTTSVPQLAAVPQLAGFV